MAIDAIDIRLPPFTKNGLETKYPKYLKWKSVRMSLRATRVEYPKQQSTQYKLTKVCPTICRRGYRSGTHRIPP